jgi:hypothetical protein
MISLLQINTAKNDTNLENQTQNNVFYFKKERLEFRFNRFPTHYNTTSTSASIGNVTNC